LGNESEKLAKLWTEGIKNQPEKGEKIVDICHTVRFTHISICIIHDNADVITESAKSGTKGFV
jgi:hypothetical protein